MTEPICGHGTEGCYHHVCTDGYCRTLHTRMSNPWSQPALADYAPHGYDRVGIPLETP